MAADSYQERVAAVASKVTPSEDGYGLTMDLDTAIEYCAMGVIDYRVGGKTRAQFLRDIKKAVKKPRAKREPMKKLTFQWRGYTVGKMIPAAELTNILGQFHSLGVGEAGQAFPDCDPTDLIFPKLRKAGVHEYYEADAIDAAFNLHEGKCFHEYLADFWDQIKADCPEVLQGQDDNPWRSHYKR